MGDLSKAAERRKAPLQTPTIFDPMPSGYFRRAQCPARRSFALYLKTKNFHWHMCGPHFRDYHLLLDEQATSSSP